MPFDADCDIITVQCASCDATGATVLVDQDVHDQSDLPSLEAEAVTAWNTRATPSPSTDTLTRDDVEAARAMGRDEGVQAAIACIQSVSERHPGTPIGRSAKLLAGTLEMVRADHEWSDTLLTPPQLSNTGGTHD